MLLLYLAAGGVLGTLARHGLAGWVHSWAGTAMPWGTLAVNVLGSFALGFLVRLTEATTLAPDMRAFLTVGLCGAFTTFSTLSFETVMLMQGGQWTRALLYAGGSFVLGIAGLAAGLSLAVLSVSIGR
jgi:CrcB protein